MSTELHPKAPAGAPGGTGGQWVIKDGKREASGQVMLMDDAELLNEAEKHAHAALGRMGNNSRFATIDPRDLASEVSLEMMRKRRSVAQAVANGEVVKHNERAYLHSIAHRVITQKLNDRHPNDRKGLYLLGEAEREFQRDHGRRMNPEERNRAADDIRMSMPPGRRAKIGFQNEIEALNVPLTTTDDRGRESIRPDADLSVSFDDHARSETANSEDAVLTDSFEEMGMAERKAMLWDALTASRDGRLPDIQPMTRTARVKANTSLASSGGVVTVLKRWQAGDLDDDDPSVVAAFAPFGGDKVTAQQQDEVASLFLGNKDYADQLYDHAAGVACRTKR